MRFVVQMYNNDDELVEVFEKQGHYAVFGVSAKDRKHDLVATRTILLNNPKALDLIRTNLAMATTISDYNSKEIIGTYNMDCNAELACDVFAKYDYGHIDTCIARYDGCCDCEACSNKE